MTRTKKLAFTSVSTALVTIATMLYMPIPSLSQGYMNVGEGVIYIICFFIGGVPAVASAGLGGMLADLLLGYGQYAIPTLLIKSAEALIACALFKKIKASRAVAVPCIVGGVWMVIGYFLTDWLLYDLAMALSGIIVNCIQVAVGVAIACVFIAFLRKNSFFKALQSGNVQYKNDDVTSGRSADENASETEHTEEYNKISTETDVEKDGADCVGKADKSNENTVGESSVKTDEDESATGRGEKNEQ